MEVVEEEMDTSDVPRLPVPPRSNERPKLSYSALIAMAIQNSPGQKATLNDVYDWIADAFPFFSRIDKAGWQNSVRHNLSLHKTFYRTKDSAGRKGGGTWRIDPKHAIGAFKRVVKSVNRPKSLAKLDDSFWEPDNDQYVDSNPLNGLFLSPSSKIVKIVATPVQVQQQNIDHNGTVIFPKIFQEYSPVPKILPKVNPEVQEREDRRQSIEEFIEMGLSQPGTSPIKNIYIEEVPLPPIESSTKKSDSNGKTIEITKKIIINPESFTGNADFYEQYDVDEVSQTGHPVITIEEIRENMHPICFLCGSSTADGKNGGAEEEMLFCKSCCEPYHPFCLNPEELPQTSEAEVNWVCRKCIQCQICGRNENERMRCGKCTNAFHEKCMLPSQRKMIEEQILTTEIWQCGTCLRCSSCQV